MSKKKKKKKTSLCLIKTGALTSQEARVNNTWIAGKEYSTEVLPKLSGLLTPNIFETIVEGMLMNFTGIPPNITTEKATFKYLKDDLLKLSSVEDVEKEHEKYSIIHRFPFSSLLRRTSVIIRRKNGSGRLYAKGGCEVILNELCTHFIDSEDKINKITELDSFDSISSFIRQYENKGDRVFGFAYREITNEEMERIENSKSDLDRESFEKNMIFVQMLGIRFPLRKGVKEAIQTFKKKGINVRMISGDFRESCLDIARESGIEERDDDISALQIMEKAISGSSFPEGMVLSGDEIKSRTNSQLRGILPQCKIVYRATPVVMKRIVEILKRMGESVIFLGLNTNSAPAMNRCDVAICLDSGANIAIQSCLQSGGHVIKDNDDSFDNIQKIVVDNIGYSKDDVYESDEESNGEEF